MTINVTCEHCESGLEVKDSLAGREVACPKCRKPITIPGDVPESEPPVLQRRKFTETTSTTMVEALVEAHAVPYPACRVMQMVFKVSGWLSLILGACLFVLLVFAAMEIGNKGNGVMQLVPIIVGILTLVVGGFGQFASAELLGGMVAFLVKNDCRSDG